MIKIKTDEHTWIIKTVGRGRWSAEDVDAYYVDLTARVTSLRQAGRPIRLLTDVTEAEMQTHEIEARIRGHGRKLHRLGDRKALVVRSNILKAHVRGATSGDDLALFCSIAAAEIWLRAHDYALRGRVEKG